MNIEVKKDLQRYTVFLLYWAAVILIAILLSSSGSGGGMSSGSGGGNEGGKGTGTGEGTGSGTYIQSAEGADDKASTEKKEATEGASGKADKVSAKPAPEKAQNSTDALMVHRKEDISDDIATIHLPGQAANNSSSGGTGKGFFGIRVSGNDRIIFLLDTSGSMASGTADGSARRIDLVKNEMKNALTAGRKDANDNDGRGVFRIVIFNSSYSFFPEQGRLTFASMQDVSSAVRFVKQLSAGGGTSMMMAWNAIISVIDRDKINLVFFLSDGESSDCTDDQLLKRLRQTVPDLRIHTISMGRSSDLLKKVAKQHKGVYREVY